jgi:hypothetical protein
MGPSMLVPNHIILSVLLFYHGCNVILHHPPLIFFYNFAASKAYKFNWDLRASTTAFSSLWTREEDFFPFQSSVIC